MAGTNIAAIEDPSSPSAHADSKSHATIASPVDSDKVIDKWAPLQNRNVQRVLLFCFIDGGSYSIWNQQVFQVLIDRLGGDKAVGWMSASSGIAQMVAAVFAGFLGDRFSRETVLRAAACAGLLAVLLSLTGVYTLTLGVFFVASFFWGTYGGINATGTEAIFADSVPTGGRAFVYNLKWIDQTLSGSIGTIVTIILLVYMGNQWELSSMRATMAVGLCLHPLAMFTLWTLRDRYALSEEMDGAAPAVVAGSGQRRASIVTEEMVVEEQEGGMVDSVQRSLNNSLCSPPAMYAANDGGVAELPPAAAHVNLNREGTPDDGTNTDNVRTAAQAVLGEPSRECIRQLEEECDACYNEYQRRSQECTGTLDQILCTAKYLKHWIFSWAAVPYLVCLVDFLVAFGSGMTMRYLPLFFVNVYDTTPSTLMTATLLISPLQALLSYGVQYAGDHHIGRLPATIAVRLSGAFLLLLMGVTHLPLPILLPIYVVRNALMNSTRGVTRSVIMDGVKKKNRAKWSAFESFSSFTWAGSATIGGYIAAAKGYQYTFSITAIFHFCALAVLVPAAFGSRPVDQTLIALNRKKAEEKRMASMVTVE